MRKKRIFAYQMQSASKRGNTYQLLSKIPRHVFCYSKPYCQCSCPDTAGGEAPIQMEENVKICVDVDQTIASGFLGESVEESLAYYRARQVAVPADARRYKDFFGLPEVIRIHEEIPNALNALQHLASAGYDMGYFTVRHSDNSSQEEQIRVNTRLWLVEHQFPHAENVFFFTGMPTKLYEIGNQISNNNSTIFFT